MKRNAIWGIMVCIGAVLFSGCEQTPENAIVREKGIQSAKNYQGGVRIGGELAEYLGAPEHYSNRAVYEDGRLVIDTDADVYVPDAAEVHTYAVTAKKETQQMVDAVTEVFFPEAKFYENDSMLDYTKEYYQKKITELKKYRAEGNFDPYHYGKKADGEYRFDLDRQLLWYEENMQEAPNESDLKETTPKLPSGDDKIENGMFLTTAMTKDGSYQYQIVYDPKWAAGIEFRIEKSRDDFFVYWEDGEYLMDVVDCTDPADASTRKKKWSEEELLQWIPIAFEDAKKIAEEKAEKLGMDLSLYGWDYQICYRSEDAILTEQNVIDGGYVFYFTRMVDHMPITYTSAQGGATEDDMEATTTIPWKYEWCNITIGGDGSVCNAQVYNPYEIGDMQIENVKLMDFDQIVQIYEQMMEISWANLATWETLRTWHITRITFGYARIYDPKSDHKSGILVPVWDFFGEFDSESEGEEPSYHSGEHTARSVMTINAIDGTLIDRELGY